MLLENGVRLTDTTWVYSMAEVEELYAEQHGAQEAEPVPESEPEPGPVAEANGPRSGQVLTSLYHVDQTPVRKAIRQAKEQKYGAILKSSEVVGNCFVVAKTDEAEHGNVFRLVYEITTTGGKEGGGASLTPEGRTFLEQYDRVCARVRRVREAIA